MNARLVHDAAHALAIELLRLIATDDPKGLYCLYYEMLRRGIESYETARARMEARLNGARGPKLPTDDEP
jgi:hypothetical protein